MLSLQDSDSSFFQKYSIDYDEPILGDGTYSVCRRCINKKTKKEFAVKIMNEQNDCEMEIQILKYCQNQHQNIVELHEVLYDSSNTYLVFELLTGGELLDRIRRMDPMPENVASKIMRSLVSTVHYMHSNKIVHRDLKPENILFVNENSDEIKIVDFGFARFIPEEGMKTPCYSFPYGAPEVMNCFNENVSSYDEQCDLWSLGVILVSNAISIC